MRDERKAKPQFQTGRGENAAARVFISLFFILHSSGFRADSYTHTHI